MDEDHFKNAFLEIWEWIKDTVAPPVVPRHRIVHIEGFGFVAQIYDGHWRAIRSDGSSCVSGDYILMFKSTLVCATEEEAGNRINKNDGHSGKVVWQG